MKPELVSRPLHLLRILSMEGVLFGFFLKVGNIWLLLQSQGSIKKELFGTSLSR